MSNMKNATVREVQHNLSAFLDRVERGEQVGITRRGRIVARLLPPAPKRRKAKWPDFAARMRRLFPGGHPRGEPPSEIIRRTREERF